MASQKIKPREIFENQPTKFALKCHAPFSPQVKKCRHLSAIAYVFGQFRRLAFHEMAVFG